ncbi:MAG: serine hydrolase [Reinekea sp.]
MSVLLKELQRRMRVRQIPGLSVRVIKNSHKIFACDLGVSSLRTNASLKPEQLFRVGSLTKPFTAQATLLLARQGRINLSDSITRYLGNWRLPDEFNNITIGYLLAHTSGLARGGYSGGCGSDDDLLAEIACTRLFFNPGEHFKYSNWGYFLLGKVIESVTGERFERFISNAIFKPLQMEQSYFSNSAEQAEDNLVTGHWKGWYFGTADLDQPSISCSHIPLPAAAAGLITNADDYLLWLADFIAKYHSDNSDRGGVFEQMLSSFYPVSQRYSIGYGLFLKTIDGLPFYHLTGSNSGYSGFVFLMPDLGLAGIALANHSTCNAELKDILYSVCQHSLAEEAIPNFGYGRTESFKLVASKRRMTVSIQGYEDGSAVFSATKQHRVRLYPHSENAYFLMNGPDRHALLRVTDAGIGDAKITFADQVYYENPSRLLRINTGEIASFELNNMIFMRQTQPLCEQHDSVPALGSSRTQ